MELVRQTSLIMVDQALSDLEVTQEKSLPRRRPNSLIKSNSSSSVGHVTPRTGEHSFRKNFPPPPSSLSLCSVGITNAESSSSSPSLESTTAVNNNNILATGEVNDTAAALESTRTVLSKKMYSEILVILLVAVGLISFYFVMDGRAINWNAYSTRSLRSSSIEEEYDQYFIHRRELAEAGIVTYEFVPNMETEHDPVRRALASAGEQEIELTLNLLDQEFHLQLVRADDLFAPNYHHILLRENGKHEIDKTRPKCIYKASIRDDKDSFGAVSLCNRNFQATLFHKTVAQKEFTITPMTDNVHVIYRHLSEQEQPQQKKHLRPCPMDHSPPTPQLHGSNGKRVLETLESWKPVGKQHKRIKLSIVNDLRRSRKYGIKAHIHSATVVAVVNSFYAQMESPDTYSVQFELLPQTTIMHEDPWHAEPSNKDGFVDSQQLLNTFYDWKKTAPFFQNAHLVHLFSGSSFSEGFVGRSAQAGATEGGVCTDRNVGVSQITGFDMSLYAKIVAHEFGHSIGLLHDNSFTDPTCSSDSNTFMWAGISLNKGTRFTPCSKEMLREFFEGRTTYPYAKCLEAE